MFSNNLVKLVGQKLDQDLDSLLKNQFQFTHTIDELILFSSQLDTYLSVSCEDEAAPAMTTPYSTLHLICENNRLFSHWLNLERQICQKKLDTLFISLNRLQQPGDQQAESGAALSLSSSTGNSGSFIFNNNEKLIDEIWSCRYSDVDTMKPSHCAETFVLMIKAITGTMSTSLSSSLSLDYNFSSFSFCLLKDRYCNLPYPYKKLRFVSLQIELLNEFHLRLCQIIRSEVKTPFGKIYLGALNTVNYITYILDEWKNSSVCLDIV